MTYFYRQQQMAKGWGKEINAAWDEVDHPRGKTTPESNDGSFMPKGGGGDPHAGLVAELRAKERGAAGSAIPAMTVGAVLAHKQRGQADAAKGGPRLAHDSFDNPADYRAYKEGFFGPKGGQPSAALVDQLGPAAYDGTAEDVAAHEARTRAYYEEHKAQQEPHTAGEAKAKAPPLGSGVKGTSYVPHDKVDVGAILYTAWGYDQTNTEFYEVTGASKSGKTVTIRELAKETSDSGFLAGHTRPVLGHYREGEKPMTKKVSASNTLKIHGNYGYGHLWDGTDKSVSWGH